ALSLSSARHHPALHSFPTRRSSDLRAPYRQRGGRKLTSRTEAAGIARFSSRRACIHSPKRCQSETRRQPTPRGPASRASVAGVRSEEHTSELQSRGHLVCRLLLEKK